MQIKNLMQFSADIDEFDAATEMVSDFVNRQIICNTSFTVSHPEHARLESHVLLPAEFFSLLQNILHFLNTLRINFFIKSLSDLFNGHVYSKYEKWYFRLYTKIGDYFGVFKYINVSIPLWLGLGKRIITIMKTKDQQSYIFNKWIPCEYYEKQKYYKYYCRQRSNIYVNQFICGTLGVLC